MPRGDGTGPFGNGPRINQGPDRGVQGCGFGGGRGLRWRNAWRRLWSQQTTKQNVADADVQNLKEQADELRKTLQTLDQRIVELEKKS